MERVYTCMCVADSNKEGIARLSNGLSSSKDWGVDGVQMHGLMNNCVVTSASG